MGNGVRVATAEMEHMNSVSLGVWIGVGSRDEPPELNGVCHFIEHLVFKGTRRRTALEISQAVEGLGGYLNAFTSEEATCFHARATHAHWEQLLDVLMDMLLEAKLAPGDVRKEREVIKEEIAMYMDEPQHQVQELLNQTLWPGQPLGRPITGTAKTLDPMRRQHVADYLARHYGASRTVVVAAGRIRHRDLLRAVSRYAKRIPQGVPRSFAPAVETQDKPRMALFTKETEQTQIALGIRTCSRHDERRFALRLLNAILGENMSSRLFQVVREDRGLAYSIYSSPSFFADTGDLVISAGMDTENASKTLRLIRRELERLAARPPGQAELRRARDYVMGQIDLSRESTESQMNWVGEQILGYGKVFTPDQVKRRLGRVTGPEIRDTARAFFTSPRLNLALVSPLKAAGGLERELMRMAAGP